jgi:hypothetical protein
VLPKNATEHVVEVIKQLTISYVKAWSFHRCGGLAETSGVPVLGKKGGTQ